MLLKLDRSIVISPDVFYICCMMVWEPEESSFSLYQKPQDKECISLRSLDSIVLWIVEQESIKLMQLKVSRNDRTSSFHNVFYTNLRNYFYHVNKFSHFGGGRGKLLFL